MSNINTFVIGEKKCVDEASVPFQRTIRVGVERSTNPKDQVETFERLIETDVEFEE